MVFEKQTFDSGFEKREFVISTAEQYPQDVKFELLKDKADKITEADVGKLVTVHFDVRGREWNGNYYNNLVAWKWEFEGSAKPEERSAFDGDVSDALDGAGDKLPF